MSGGRELSGVGERPDGIEHGLLRPAAQILGGEAIEMLREAAHSARRVLSREHALNNREP